MQQQQQQQEQKWQPNVERDCLEIIKSMHGQPKAFKQPRNSPLILVTAGIDVGTAMSLDTVCVQMGVSDIGFRLLRAHPGVKAYIEEKHNLKPTQEDNLEFQILESSKISYNALQTINDRQTHYYPEKLGDRIGQLSNDINIDFNSLLSVCQIFGYYTVVFKLLDKNEVVRNTVYETLCDEKERFERILDRRLLNLWYDFGKPKMDYEQKIASFK